MPNPRLQRHYRALQAFGSAVPCNQIARTRLPQLVAPLVITQTPKTASSPHVDLTVLFPRNACHHEPKAFLMAAASFLSSAGPHRSTTVSVWYGGGVYPGVCIGGVIRVCTRCFTALLRAKRPESTFYRVTAPLRCGNTDTVTHRFIYLITGPAATQGTSSWLSKSMKTV